MCCSDNAPSYMIYRPNVWAQRQLPHSLFFVKTGAVVIWRIHCRLINLLRSMACAKEHLHLCANLLF